MPTSQEDGADRPRVSVVMANWQGERHLASAIGSVLGQSMGDLELLVADDASTDRSLEIARAAAARDPRVRVLPAEANGGAATARNRAFDAARGEWVAIVDSDDLLHPRRLALLLEAAERTGAEVVADDVVGFGGEWPSVAVTLLAPLGLRAVTPVPAEEVLRGEVPRSGAPPLGYVKPLIRRDAIGRARQDARLPTCQDLDFLLRLLLAGARLALVPLPLYLYRRRPTSLSAGRFQPSEIRALLAAQDSLAADPALAAGLAAPGVAPMLARRRDALEATLRQRLFHEALRSGRPWRALPMAARHPRLLRSLAREGVNLVARRRPPPGPETGGAVALVPEGAPRPPDLAGCRVIEVPPIGLGHLDRAGDLARVARRIADLATWQGARFRALGPEGADALGLVPR